ncbi:MAG TPA: 3-dehydroquinate synthase [Egibacteraceae bacterium]|nr:3-dehydroquinate synthase [Egibacteraceae bacterium]
MTDQPTPARVRVPVPGASYDVVVGAGLLERLAEHVRPPAHAARAAVVSSGPVTALYGARAVAALGRLGLQVHPLAVPDGEDAKSLATLESLYHRFAAIPINRDDLVVALGGGTVGDLAGFAAATWNRGVAVLQLPTTLLAQADAAIGGKTGVNLPEGKNLVGAFHQPLAVVADTATLATLPVRERRSGLGELAKYGFIADPTVLDLLEAEPAAAVAGDPDLLAAAVARGVAVKAAIVAADEREAGQRALLNYGHTLGHAIETLTGYATYRHGEAVALGMVFAARLGERLGVSDPGLDERTVGLLAGLGLPTGGLRLDPAAVWAVLGRDKKARGRAAPKALPGGGDQTGGVRFVLCRRPGSAVVVERAERRVVDEVLRSLS